MNSKGDNDEKQKEDKKGLLEALAALGEMSYRFGFFV